MSFIEYLPEVVQRGMRAVDGWVAKNVSSQTQSMVIVSLFFMMCLHLVYTKRKLQGEEKEKQKKLREEKQKKN